MSEKSDSDHSDKSDVRTGGSDMRVSVMYRGMVYRVKGIKVLCSVVTAVILLLVAIVGLGVWMLVSAYAEEKSLTVAANATRLTESTETPSSTPYTIDFNAPSATLDEVSLPAVVANTMSSEDLHVNEAIGHFQGVTPSQKVVVLSPRPPAPGPDYGLFSGLLDVGDGGGEASTLPQDSVSDSVVQHSETRTVLAPSPPHYATGDHLHPSHTDSNRRMDEHVNDYSPGRILQGGLPDNIPRDIDPMLLDMGLPFSYPPSIPTRAPNPRLSSPLPQRPIYPGYRGEPQDVTTNPWSTPPPRYHHSLPPVYYDYDYSDQEAHDGTHEGQDYYYEHHPRVSDAPTQATTARGDLSNIYTEPHTPTTDLDHSRRQWLAPGRGQPPSGFTFPPGVTVPSGMTFPGGITLPADLEGLRRTAEEGLKDIRIGPGSYLDDMMHYYNKHEGTRPTTTSVSPPASDDAQYSHRTGMTKKEEATGYSGPPVVGYGDRPLKHRSDPVFQHFWDVYGHDSRAPGRHDDRGPVPEETWGPHSFGVTGPNSMNTPPQNHEPRPIHLGPRPDQFRRRLTSGAPHPTIRGPRPGGQGYPLPLRPDAERPPVLLPDRKLWVGLDHSQPTKSGQPLTRPTPSRTKPNPINSRSGPVDDTKEPSNIRPGPLNTRPGPLSTPSRPVRTRSGPNIQPRPVRTRPGPSSARPGQANIRPGPSHPPNHRPFLGPLYNIYNYSKRLASTLLSFPATLNTRYNASREEYMQNEVELLEDYNKVFQNSNTSTTDVLPDMFDDRPSRNERLMLIDSSKLRSLSGFELSLITWTFLDFWEFLIEKVGTLSKDDLRLLEQRLERVRQNKDRVMTQSFMTATANHRVDKNPADAITPDISRAIAMAEDLLRSLPGVGKQTISASPSTSTSSTSNFTKPHLSDVVEGRMWDPLGVFSSEERVKFMEFAIKVLFKFGRVYLTKTYALDCMMLLFCKDLNAGAKKDGMDGMAAKLKSVGLKVLTERDSRQVDTMGEIWRSLTAWETLHCETMFPRCDGPKALEIVNDVALGSRRK